MSSIRNLFKSNKTETEQPPVKEVRADEGSLSSSEEEAEDPSVAPSTDPSTAPGGPHGPDSKVAPHSPMVTPKLHPDKTSMERTSIRKRLDDAVKNTPVTHNRSAEMVPLTQQYEENRKNVRTLYAAAKAYQKSLHDMHVYRIEMIKNMSLIAEDTPLFDAIGNLVNDGEGDAPKSLEARARAAAVVAERQSKSFDANILDYLAEWETVTSELASSGIKQANKFKEDRVHYESKVDKLRKKAHTKEESGKNLKKSHASKLDRNEGKLRRAYEDHEKHCGHLCVLLEQMAGKDDRWRDLLPLAKAYMQWEEDRFDSETETFEGLEHVLGMMDDDVEEATQAGV